MAKVGIINFGMGNLRSIEGKVKRLGHHVTIVEKASDLDGCQKLILPGVGNFEKGIQNLRGSPFFASLEKTVLEEKVPVLGICLGMQLMTTFSEEGNVKGLNWIPGRTERFKLDLANGFRVPHMGWNKVNWDKAFSLVDGIQSGKRFYFTHSYFVRVDDRANSLASTDYGCKFDTVINRENIFGTQFHPEKSHQYGLDLINNFLGEK